ncbi:MAG: 3-deoxy-7-phosphoheptulonate synthase [Oscillospiraceae bacterium]|jgi:3-deoxy-7-phosphoheptulonate synthase|nr:3-deoxy-7-phosphoheptulonate synthase [Oscillospiraceae bacterium]
MIIVCNKNASTKSVDELVKRLEEVAQTHISKGENSIVIGLVGDTSKLDPEDIKAYPIVEKVQRVSEPFKLANRKFHEADTVIDIGGVKIGGGDFAVMAGPCSVETEEQIVYTAKMVKQSGAKILRGGAFKPRTSPYAFRGLKAEGIRLLEIAKKETGLPIVTELMSLDHLEYFENVDIIQIGARNMQNFEMLSEIGQINKPILLKRGLANTIEEWLMSAEYIMANGNENVILCERGIRTFETALRNTYDLACVPYMKALTHLPIIGDPSHATGKARLVRPLARATKAVGADGLMIEVHPNPAKALCDGAQSVTPEEFELIMQEL